MSDIEKKTPGDSPETDGNEDKTILFQPQPVAPEVAASPQVPVEDDATVIAPLTEAEDADRTILASDAEARSQDSTANVDPDATVIASRPPASDPDATVIAQTTESPITRTETSAIIPAVAGATAGPLNSLEPGVVINNMYRVEERLDQGGMGRVFRGEEIGTGESVAIKVILPEMAEDTKVADMFRREARVLRKLHHDAIVRYFAYVPPDETLNLHALVMGFIQGTKLSETLKEGGPLSRDNVIKLTLRLAGGLERAHSVGIVHRDLSPDNVMLQDGDIAQAVLIDFGISRSSTVKDVTIGNEFAGKLKYVSPEQMGAFGGQAEAQSDVYSLGLLMIAMLMGKPFDMGGNFVEAVQKRQAVPDLSFLPEEFQPLLHEMLQPDPAQRLAGMTEVIEALKALEGGGTGLGGLRSRGTMPPLEATLDRAVPGLQAVPFAATSTGGTSAPRTMPPSDVVLPKSGGRGIGTVLTVVTLVAAVGAAIFFADDLLPVAATQSEDTADPVAAGLERVPGTRATFLAEAVPADCAYAARRAHGGSAGLIEGFAQDLAPLQGLGAAFGAAFGSAPEVIARNVTAAQCSVLDFAHSLQGTAGAGVELSLAANTTSRSTGVVGTLHGSAGRQNWLALVDPNGQVFSLMRQFDDPIGDERRFAFRLPSAAPGIYMLVATASENPLVRAGAMRDGTPAADILPLMTRELAVDGQGAVDVAFLELTR